MKRVTTQLIDLFIFICQEIVNDTRGLDFEHPRVEPFFDALVSHFDREYVELLGKQLWGNAPESWGGQSTKDVWVDLFKNAGSHGFDVVTKILKESVTSDPEHKPDFVWERGDSLADEIERFLARYDIECRAYAKRENDGSLGVTIHMNQGNAEDLLSLVRRKT